MNIQDLSELPYSLSVSINKNKSKKTQRNVLESCGFKLIYIPKMGRYYIKDCINEYDLRSVLSSLKDFRLLDIFIKEDDVYISANEATKEHGAYARTLYRILK